MEMLEIERELLGPRGGATLKRHEAVLNGLDRRIAAAMSTGLNPREFADVDRLRKAVRQSRDVLRLVYGQRNAE